MHCPPPTGKSIDDAPVDLRMKDDARFDQRMAYDTSMDLQSDLRTVLSIFISKSRDPKGVRL